MISRYGGFTSVKYEEYSSKDPALNITMDYISGWRYSEHRGSYNSYAQVQFYGPIKKDFAPSIVATVQRRSKVKVKPLTIEAIADDLIAKRMKLKDTKVLSRSKMKLLGSPAINIALTYKKPDKLRSMDAKFIPFKEGVVIFQKQGKFYTLRYMNPQEEFKKFSRAFYHCVKSLRMK
jgi:hypothetical protein